MSFANRDCFRRSVLAAAVAAGLALSGGYAAAQATDNPSSKAATETKRGEKDARRSWEQTHRASKIIGSEVRNAQDQKVGRVKDLVLGDPASGTISHVVVSVGGIAGMGDKLFAVPFSQIQQAQGKDYLVLSATSDLSKGFDEKNWPTDTSWQARSDTNRTTAAGALSAPSVTTPPPVATPSAPPAAAPSTPPSSSAASPADDDSSRVTTQ